MNDLQEHINQEVKDALDSHTEHLRIANQEMGAIKTDIAWLKETVTRIDGRIWYVLASIIAMGIIQIAIKAVWR